MSANFQSRNKVAQEYDAQNGTPQPGPSNHNLHVRMIFFIGNLFL